MDMKKQLELFAFANPQTIISQTWKCGYCGHIVASDRGYKLCEFENGDGLNAGGIYICPNCKAPTFFAPDKRCYPSASYGNPVDQVPNDVNAIYEEARRCTAQKCYTAAVLLCRNILMHIAVDQGAGKNWSFAEYVDYLSESGYIPVNAKGWVDHIRTKGNEATHEITLMNDRDAKDIITFTEMLLRIIYEFPSKVPTTSE